MQPKAARSNHLGASRRSSCPRSFIALPACLDVRLSPARNLTTRDWLAYVGHRVYLGLRRVRVAHPSDCVDTAANRQQKDPVCRSTSRARNIWNQLLHRGDGERNGQYRFMAQAHERHYLPDRVYCSWRNAFCPRMPRQRIRLSKSKITLIGLVAAAILLGILMSLCLALSLLLVDIVRRAVVESIKARMNG